MDTVIITGAKGGIGSAMTKAFVSAGYKVIAIHSPWSSAEASEWHRLHSFLPHQVKLVAMDVTNTEECDSVLSALLDEEKKIDVLVNNAGCTDDISFRKMSKAQWDKTIRTNLDSLFNVTRPLFSSMCENNFGRVINISSVNGLKGQYCQVNYAAAKAGMLGFTKALACEGAKYQVTVNAVAPGYTQTPMLDKVSENAMKSIKDSILLKRLATPEEIASTVLFLASESSGYITGETISVNGGLYMH